MSKTRENPWNWIPAIAILAIFLLIVFFRATKDENSAEITPKSSIQQETTKQWVEIAKFTGTDDKRTETFKTQSNRFRIAYATDSEYAKYATMYLYIYPEDENSRYIDSLTINGQTKDQSIIRTSPGKYYFKINEANVDSWQIIVEEEQ
jgi:hypothetical protein